MAVLGLGLETAVHPEPPTRVFPDLVFNTTDHGLGGNPCVSIRVSGWGDMERWSEFHLDGAIRFRPAEDRQDRQIEFHHQCSSREEGRGPAAHELNKDAHIQGILVHQKTHTLARFQGLECAANPPVLGDDFVAEAGAEPCQFGFRSGLSSSLAITAKLRSWRLWASAMASQFP